MRKIHVVVLDTFETKEEASAFRSAATSRLRFEHPAVIVQVDLAGSLREPVVTHAYGFVGDDKSRAEEAAGRIVAEMLGVLHSPLPVDLIESPPGGIEDPSSSAEEKCVKIHLSDSA
jgi:hypothetical protein